MQRSSSRALGITLGMVLGWHVQAQAQGLPVFDAANLTQNLIQAAQTIIMVANQVLELTGLGEIVVGDEFQRDLDSLGEVVSAARALSFDVASLDLQIQTLFQLQTVPRSASDLQIRLREIRQVVFQSYVYAMRTHTLLTTAERTVKHLKSLIAAVGDLVGNMQSNQTLVQVEHTISATMEKIQVQTTAYNHAQSLERLSEAMTMESIRQINLAIMADYP